MWVMGLVVAVLILVVVVRLVRSSSLEFYHEAECVRPRDGVGTSDPAPVIQEDDVPRCEKINDLQWLDSMGISVGKGVSHVGDYAAG